MLFRGYELSGERSLNDFLTQQNSLNNNSSQSQPLNQTNQFEVNKYKISDPSAASKFLSTISSQPSVFKSETMKLQEEEAKYDAHKINPDYRRSNTVTQQNSGGIDDRTRSASASSQQPVQQQPNLHLKPLDIQSPTNSIITSNPPITDTNLIQNFPAGQRLNSSGLPQLPPVGPDPFARKPLGYHPDDNNNNNAVSSAVSDDVDTMSVGSNASTILTAAGRNRRPKKTQLADSSYDTHSLPQ
jgi:hypothetical protein